MKNLKQLDEIRMNMQPDLALRTGDKHIRVQVAMGTCGINAGAREILNCFAEEICEQGLFDTASVVQTGCIGLCAYEPVAEVLVTGREKVTYVHLTKEKVKKIVQQHMKDGTPVSEYTIENVKA